MSAYAELFIGKYAYLREKNNLSGLLLPYSPDDRRLIPEEAGWRYQYVTDARRAAQCLDVAGYSLAALKGFFPDILVELAYDIDVVFGRDGERPLDLFRQFSFTGWYEAVTTVARHLSRLGWDLRSDAREARQWLSRIPREDTVPHFIASSFLTRGNPLYFGLPQEYTWYAFRAVLDAFPPDEPVILDYTDPVRGGWCDTVQEEEQFPGEKTVVLTEGKFDAKILPRCMDVLYPHLSRFFYFMDFDMAAVQGSASFLSHYLKAFIGARIQNRIIGLFDNDTAALCEMQNLKKIRLPPNVKVMRLPDTALARRYPTLGPYDNQVMDINGLACSVELYFGRDVLTGEDGSLTPVLWKGYMDRVGKYQGEIMGKGHMQARFMDKLRAAERGGPVERENWLEMDLLLQALITAFN